MRQTGKKELAEAATNYTKGKKTKVKRRGRRKLNARIFGITRVLPASLYSLESIKQEEEEEYTVFAPFQSSFSFFAFPGVQDDSSPICHPQTRSHKLTTKPFFSQPLNPMNISMSYAPSQNASLGPSKDIDVI